MEKKQTITTERETLYLLSQWDNDLFFASRRTLYVEDEEDNGYRNHAEYLVEGEAFKFLVKREEDEILARVERARKEAIVPKEEKEAQALKEKNGGWFIFRAFFRGFWFYYEFEAKSLADAERIGWKSLAKETAHCKGDWKGGRVTKRKVRVWFCE
jgi:hypothetical protein